MRISNHGTSSPLNDELINTHSSIIEICNLCYYVGIDPRLKEVCTKATELGFLLQLQTKKDFNNQFLIIKPNGCPLEFTHDRLRNQ